MKENGLSLNKVRSRWYPGEPFTDADYVDYQALLENTPSQAESLLLSLYHEAIDIWTQNQIN